MKNIFNEIVKYLQSPKAEGGAGMNEAEALLEAEKILKILQP